MSHRRQSATLFGSRAADAIQDDPVIRVTEHASRVGSTAGLDG